MDALKKSDFQSKVIRTSKDISIDSVNFSSSAITSSAYYSLKQLFYPATGSAVEYIDFQNRDLLSGQNMIWYQTPYNKRGTGIKPESFTLTFSSSYGITDDGDGNLTYGGQHIGNIFYNTGMVFITGTGSFSGSVDSIQDIAENPSETSMVYERYVEYKITRTILDVPAGKFKSSSNSTFSGSNAPYPYLTRAYIYNSQNEIIMEMAISRPLELSTDFVLIGDIYETLQ